MMPIRLSPNSVGVIEQLNLDGKWQPIAILVGTDIEKGKAARELVESHDYFRVRLDDNTERHDEFLQELGQTGPVKVRKP